MLRRGLDTGRPKQKLQPKQAYSVLNWLEGKCLKTRIDAEWKLKLIDEPGLTPKDYLAYRNMRLDQMLAAETQEVKDEVERFRNRKDIQMASVDPLILPHEQDLPQEQKDDLLVYRSIQR